MGVCLRVLQTIPRCFVREPRPFKKEAGPLLVIPPGQRDISGNFGHLPFDLIRLIFTFLDPQDLGQATRWNRLYYHVSVALISGNRELFANSALYCYLRKFTPQDSSKTVENNLKKFHIATEVILESHLVSSTVLQEIALFTRIETLELRIPALPAFKGLKPGDLEPLVRAHPEISRFELGSCPNIPDKELKRVVRTCQKLIELSLNFRSVAASFVEETVEKHPQLESLILSGTTKVTNKTLKTIAKRCTKLRVLILSGCQAVTFEGIAAIGSLKELHFLTLNDCLHTDLLNRWYLSHKNNFQLKKVQFSAENK